MRGMVLLGVGVGVAIIAAAKDSLKDDDEI